MAFATGATGETRVRRHLQRHGRYRLPGELAWAWVPLAAGDCTFHSGCVYHRADANRTSAMREVMTVAYMSADAVYDWPEWNSRVEDTHGFGTAGLRRGDPLNKPTTPRLA